MVCRRAARSSQDLRRARLLGPPNVRRADLEAAPEAVAPGGPARLPAQFAFGAPRPRHSADHHLAGEHTREPDRYADLAAWRRRSDARHGRNAATVAGSSSTMLYT